MENLISRYRNVTILVAVLFAQVLGLAVQVKRNSENESSRLIRIWAVDSVTPLEKGIVWLQSGTGNLWHSYFYLRGVRQENRDLKQQIEQLKIEQTRLRDDAEQAHRLQLLLGFKEQFIAKTTAAQVIGSSGSEQSRIIYIDKGSDDGVKPGMAVITADGVVGKVLRVSNDTTSQVLLINDQSSGVGAILEKSRLQGVLRGTALGEVTLDKIMSDEAVEPGERVLTSGGDQIFPKGLPVGTVTKTTTGPDLFLSIRVKPAADLSKLEEVLVITQEVEKEPSLADAGPMRAADILAERLPSVPDKPAVDPSKADPTKAGANKTDANKTDVNKPGAAAPVAGKPVVKPASPKPSSSKPSSSIQANQTSLGQTSPNPASPGQASSGQKAKSAVVSAPAQTQDTTGSGVQPASEKPGAQPQQQPDKPPPQPAPAQEQPQ